MKFLFLPYLRVDFIAILFRVPQLLEKCPEIRWHFIGHLQRNKAKKLAACPNLYMVETVDSEKLADALNSAVATTMHGDGKLRVMAQINTSREEGTDIWRRA